MRVGDALAVAVDHLAGEGRAQVRPEDRRVEERQGDVEPRLDRVVVRHDELPREDEVVAGQDATGRRQIEEVADDGDVLIGDADKRREHRVGNEGVGHFARRAPVVVGRAVARAVVAGEREIVPDTDGRLRGAQVEQRRLVPAVFHRLEGDAAAAREDVGVRDGEDGRRVRVHVRHGRLDVDPGLAIGHRVSRLRQERRERERRAGERGIRAGGQQDDAEDRDRCSCATGHEDGSGKALRWSAVEDHVCGDVHDVVDLGELVVLVTACPEVDDDAAAGQRFGDDRDAEVRCRRDAEDGGLDLVVAQEVVAGSAVEVGAAERRQVGSREGSRFGRPDRRSGPQARNQSERQRDGEDRSCSHGSPPLAPATPSGVAENRSRIMEETPSAWETFSEHFATSHPECGDCQSRASRPPGPSAGTGVGHRHKVARL